MIVTTNKYGNKRKYVVGVADFKALGANLTGNITLETFPADSIIRGAKIENTELVAGTAITDADVQLKWGATGSEASYGSSIDVDTALVSATTTTVTAGSATTTNTALLALTWVGGNLNASTQGVIEVELDIDSKLTN
jgi:hypothetical protein